MWGRYKSADWPATGFCSVRAGNYGEIDFWTVDLIEGSWNNLENAGARLNGELSIGELHMLDENRMYFHWDDTGGQGGIDIWSLSRGEGDWGEPENLGPVVNGEGNEAFPFVSRDDDELWYIADSQQGYPGPSIWRSQKQLDDSWGEGEEIIACFAAEPTLDNQENIYFAHHYFEGVEMVEADIYVAWRE